MGDYYYFFDISVHMVKIYVEICLDPCYTLGAVGVDLDDQTVIGIFLVDRIGNRDKLNVDIRIGGIGVCRAARFGDVRLFRTVFNILHQCIIVEIDSLLGGERYRVQLAGAGGVLKRCVVHILYRDRYLGCEAGLYDVHRAHETGRNLVCRLLLEKKKNGTSYEG